MKILTFSVGLSFAVALNSLIVVQSFSSPRSSLLLKGLTYTNLHNTDPQKKQLFALPCYNDDSNNRSNDVSCKRRNVLSTLLKTSSLVTLSTSALLGPWAAQALDTTTTTTTTTTKTTTTATSKPSFISPSEADITHKVFFDVRISRQDGTFYVRDDLPDTPENRVFYGRLTIGLFGNNAPRHVQNFLSYIPQDKASAAMLVEENPLPSYGRSTFPSIDQATGVLAAGKIPGLQLTQVNASPALQYYGRLLPASLWFEKTNPTPISHSAKGLLTHERFDVTPAFAVTTRKDTTVLDATHTVFGQILTQGSNENDGAAFLSLVQDLPTYGLSRATSSTEPPTVVDEAATRVFAAQREFFRSTAKTFGDTRLDKVYEGKFLRRVEVTQVGVL